MLSLTRENGGSGSLVKEDNEVASSTTSELSSSLVSTNRDDGGVTEENWKNHLDFVNNFLIEQSSFNFPFEGSPQSLRNISIVHALIKANIVRFF